jgi:hypothetical protein
MPSRVRASCEVLGDGDRSHEPKAWVFALVVDPTALRDVTGVGFDRRVLTLQNV